jgi:hypothetical protein
LCGGCSLSPSQSSHPKPPKSKLFSVDFAFPKSSKVLSIISHSFDPLEFAFLLLNPQIFPHPRNIDSPKIAMLILVNLVNVGLYDVYEVF